MRGQFSIVTKDVSGAVVGNLDHEVKGLVLSTVATGVFSAAWRLERKFSLFYPDLGFPYEVVVADGKGVFHRTTLARYEPELGDTSEWLNITALNTLASRTTYDSETFVATTPLEDVFASIATDRLGGMSTSLATTGRTLTADLTVTDKTAADVGNLVAALGDSSNTPLVWGIWPDGTDGDWQLQLAAQSTTPDYFVQQADYRGKIGFDGSRYANRQKLRYSGGSLITVNDTTEQTLRGGVFEGKPITRSDITHATDATAIATTALNRRKQLRLSADQATIAAPWAIRGSDGLGVPLWRVRAGKVLGIEGPQPSGQAGSYSFDRNMLYIVRTDYAVDTGVLTLTFEDFETSLEGMLGRLLRQTGMV